MLAFLLLIAQGSAGAEPTYADAALDAALPTRAIIRQPPARERPVPQLGPQLPAAVTGVVDVALAPLALSFSVTITPAPMLHPVEAVIHAELPVMEVVMRAASEEDEARVIAELLELYHASHR